MVAGTGAPSARQASVLTRDARDAGADAVLALCPPRNNDPRPYYDAVAEAAGDLPSLAYHFPQTSPPGIPVDALPDQLDRHAIALSGGGNYEDPGPLDPCHGCVALGARLGRAAG